MINIVHEISAGCTGIAKLIAYHCANQSVNQSINLSINPSINQLAGFLEKRVTQLISLLIFCSYLYFFIEEVNIPISDTNRRYTRRTTGATKF